MTAATKPPMTYFGGKTRLAATISALLPDHTHYVEPFAGSLAVLLSKRPSRMETVNDLDGDMMTFWRVLRDHPQELASRCALTPHSRAELAEARDRTRPDLDDIERARRVWVRVTQARTGTLRSDTGWRHYVDPAGSKTSMSAYLDGYVARMAAAARRLHNVSLECRPALDLIRGSYGACPGVCLYVDPPYLGSTRRSGKYQTDMTATTEHEDLLHALVACKAAVVLSGYASPLYDAALAGWSRVEVATTTGQGGNRQARTEVLWCNRSPQPTLFDLDVTACS